LPAWTLVRPVSRLLPVPAERAGGSGTGRSPAAAAAPRGVLEAVVRDRIMGRRGTGRVCCCVRPHGAALSEGRRLREIDPDLQNLEAGQWVSMSPTPSKSTAWKAGSFAQNEWLLWRKPDSTWSWVLRDLADGRTRLITRVHALYDWSHPAYSAFGAVLMELGDFAMMRRMLLGIKERAESTPRAAGQ